jgi:hypothetical protein
MNNVPARAVAAAAGLLLIPILAACGGSSSNSAATNPGPTSSSPAASLVAPADKTAATAEIKANWKTFFAYKTPRATAAGLLEDGSTMTAALAKAVSEQAATHIKQGAEVTSVTFTSPTTAQVSYKLLNGSAVLLPSATGQAVLVDGTWRVSKATFCTLVTLGNNNQPVTGC